MPHLRDGATANATSRSSSRPSEVHDIAIDAYVFLYPLVLMELTRRQMTNCSAPDDQGRSPMGAFGHARAYPAATSRMVVRPNFDTLYSVAWLDVRSEPAIVRLPPTPERYVILPMMDMWTDVFASPGSRTTGDAGGLFAVTAPGWHGDLPDGSVRIDAPTPTVWIIGRTQTNGPDDYPSVHTIQDGFETAPLSRWVDASAPPAIGHVDPSIDQTTPPLRQVNALDAGEFFTLATDLLALHPVHATDWSMLARLERIGIVPGELFDPSSLTPEDRQAMMTVPEKARQVMLKRGLASVTVTDGWQLSLDTMGVYGNFYAKRAAVALAGLGALPPEDAIYPRLIADSDGQPPDGAHDYLLHFDADQLPPVDAFWSITMYDGEGFQAANQLDRFALGDRDPLELNDDGSLDIVLQHESPGDGLESNWLPAPVGPLGVTLRLYSPLPRPDGSPWTPPPVQRVR
ncbi:MAG: DUF1254 domain-containing protein [Acidimicrobiales bacterium]